MATQRRIAIACGGTAGHVHPALALADAYRESYPDAELLFIGTLAGLESDLVPARGYRLKLIPGEPLAGEPLGGKVRALLALLAGTIAARKLLAENKIKLVIGFGGYATAGAIAAARSLGIKIALHEANVEPGLTNRWLARLADRVYVTFKDTVAALPKGRALVTGNPVRREIAALCAQRNRRPAGPKAARFFITGGSGGSNFLNREVPALLHKIAAQGITPEALHQAGAFPLAPIRAVYERWSVTASVTDYIPDIQSAYAWADFVIACAGSQTLSELAVCGVPCLLVPLSSAAAGHQVANAAAFAEMQGALWTAEENWDADWMARQIAARLRDQRGGLATDEPFGAIDAAEKIIADCEEMMKGRWDAVISPNRS
jgi:UDP-N-acetylglucosamine--N-acetylmuramyl-(pentapeptide) pyrophosphoryl-undecaprenol N-acetylglucosamine transferase